MMNLVKGSIVKQTRVNNNSEFKGTCANSILIYEVVRVNKKTYGLKCVEGYRKGTGCNLLKVCPEKSVDVYGTVTTWEEV